MDWNGLVTACAMGITAGAPAGFVFLNHMTTIGKHLLRAVEALEKIADRLENAEFIQLGRAAK